MSAHRTVTSAIVILLVSLPAESRAQTSDTKVDASRGGVTISSGVNSLTIGARAQVRWTLDEREEGDSDTAGTGAGEPDGPVSSFDVPRLRVTLGGGVWREWLKYTFQFDFSRTSGEGDSKIKDALIEIRPVGRPYRLALGQFKVPFGLQQLVSSGRQQFVDRAITDAKFSPGREMGAMMAGAAASRVIGYEVGVFNGSGESIRQTNRSHLWAARLFAQPFGGYSLSESALEAGDRAVLHVGVAIRGGEPIRGRTPTAIFDEADNETAFDLELGFKTPRVFATAEYFRATGEQSNPVRGDDIDSDGFHAQAGYMVVPATAEVAVRYARIAGDTHASDAEVTEVRAVVGYFWQGHNLKLQTDVGRLGYGPNFGALSPRARQGLPSPGPRLVSGEDLSDTQVRVQLQVAF